MNRVFQPTAQALATAIALALSCSAAQAQTHKMSPGLWEQAMKMQDQGGQMAAAMKQAQEAMASLPPDQRKMMEDMMAKQGVVVGAGGQSAKMCLSKEDIERDQMPAQEGCTQSAQRSGNTWTVSFQCPAKGGQPASSGKGTHTLQSPTAYTGQFTMNTVVQGKPEQMTMTTNGRWLGADCGNLKPMRR